MEQAQETETRPEVRRLRAVFSGLNIQWKIILPYLVLTFTVAIIGLFVVSRLVVSSISERLNNQLLEAGRVVSDKLALQELDHIEAARAVVLTAGLAEAVEAGDPDGVVRLAQPVATVEGVEALLVFDAQGQEMVHMLRQEDGTLQGMAQALQVSDLPMVQDLLTGGDPGALPRRGLAFHRSDQRYYYLTAIPIGLEGRVVGVTLVGTSMDTLLRFFKQTSLADVTIYLDEGRAIATTFALTAQTQDTTLDLLSTDPDLYRETLAGETFTTVENVQVEEEKEVRGRPYRLAYGPLRVGNDTLGAFSVGLPSNFIVEKGVTSRNTYVSIFLVAMAGVFAIGYLISQRITVPLGQLVRTSQAVADGHLDRRTGIIASDEIGFLASTFDQMTGRLEERTHALEESVGRMRAILSSIGDGVILEDLEGRFVPLNAAAEVLLEEMSANFLLGPLREPPDYDDVVEVQPNPWLLERRRFEVGQKVVSAHSAAVRTDDGEHLGSVIVLRDVTAEVEAEHLKDAFVTHVSHELRTPLTAIKGYSELLLGSAGESMRPDQRAFLHTISRHTDNLVDMVNALLDFSEMEASGRLGLRLQSISLEGLVDEIAEEWQDRMADKSLSFDVETPVDLPPVSADPKRLRWAIINLVRNAWQYTPEGGLVSLKLSSRDDRVVLDVVDNGMGISPTEQQKIFSRFYNVMRTRYEADDDVRGLGLGLYVTKAIIEAHEGEISFVSQLEVGSTFTISLPIAETE